MEKIYVARVFAYNTPGEKAKGKASVGMSLASKLNGNAHWVGTFVENADDDRKTGFITSPQKFPSLEAAHEHVAKMEKLYPRGAVLNSKEWEWGERDEDSSMEFGINIHIVRFRGHDIEVDRSAIHEGNSQMVYQGKVAEPLLD